MSTFPVQQWNLGIGPISCHAWNRDRTMLAVSPSNNEIHVFRWQNGRWTLAALLAEHDLPITGLDWAPKTNRIVSCSQDKNAFVWTFDGEHWKPELVVVRMQRAATCVRWSPYENKFAVGSGAKLVSVCYYERENDWWICKQIKKPIRSTVTCIDWHPNNVLLAVGACDFKARVFSAYVKEVDEKPSPNPWGTKMPFGALMCEAKSSGWIHHVAFSPSGCRLSYVAHDSTVAVIDTNRSLEEAVVLRTAYLPFTSIQWVTENSLVAAGHDYSPMLFMYSDDQLKFVTKLDIPSEQKSANINSAMQKFRNIDRNAAVEAVDIRLRTMHQNAITEILPHSGRNDNMQKFSTCAIDGLVALWDLKVSFHYMYVYKLIKI
uniref:Actin-related protein 2/3 complex subunit n=1 Tax=Onchocerca volvulus TaxID=6282 RepID=A0A2K6WIA1_ONCVO